MRLILILFFLFGILFSCSFPPQTATPVPLFDGTICITEIGTSYFSNGSSWIEVYNSSNKTADLSAFQLRTYGLNRNNGSGWGIYAFALPYFLLGPGMTVLIRGQGNDAWVSGGQILYIRQWDIVPFYSNDGFAEMVQNNTTLDFVRWGSSDTQPLSSNAWSGSSAPAMSASSADDLGKSLGRDGNYSDTNSPADWSFRTFATPGGPNDVTGNADTDSDGIPDSSEINGSSFAGMDLFSWGARTGQKDLFIHIAYMVDTNAANNSIIVPRKAALDKMKTVFASMGYAVHFDAGNLFTGQFDPASYNLDQKDHNVPFAQAIALGKEANKANLYAIKNTYFDLRKRQVFYYMLFANSQNTDGSGGSSGIAETFGNDSIITLGGWNIFWPQAQQQNNLAVNYQAATMVHEFGHNLGLLHGGNEETNYKPNYYSVMNYLYQLYGLPPLDANCGDRYYAEYQYKGKDVGNIADGPLSDPSVFRIAYSDGSGLAFNESDVNESKGIGRGNFWVDYNNNSVINGSAAIDLNHDSAIQTALADFNDTAALHIIFMRTFSGDASGAFYAKTSPAVFFSPIGDDFQSVRTQPCAHQPLLH